MSRLHLTPDAASRPDPFHDAFGAVVSQPVYAADRIFKPVGKDGNQDGLVGIARCPEDLLPFVDPDR